MRAVRGPDDIGPAERRGVRGGGRNPSKPVAAFQAPVCGDGSFHHVAATLSQNAAGLGVATLYVDGAQAAQMAGYLGSGIAVDTARNGPAALGVGGSANSAEPLSGSVSDVRVFARALAANEIKALARPVLPAFPNAVLSPNPDVANASTTSFIYTCALGFAGPTVTISRSAADGSWSSSGGAVACVPCSATQFAIPGSSAPCINLPSLPSAPNTVVSRFSFVVMLF